MKILTYGLVLIVSMLIVVGAVIEYATKYFPIVSKQIQIGVKKLYSHSNKIVNKYAKKPTYSY